MPTHPTRDDARRARNRRLRNRNYGRDIDARGHAPGHSGRSENLKSLWQRVAATAVDPSGWAERNERAELVTRFTTVGARPRHELTGELRAIHGLSSVMIISPPARVTPDAQTSYWVTVARRLLQRGTMPIVPCALPEAWPEHLDAPLLSALFALPAFDVDPDLELDERYERRFFEDVRKRYPAESIYLIPQAPLSSIGKGGADHTTQWVDFLFAPPTGPDTVFELDGSQHRTAAAVDQRRDRSLAGRGTRTVRVAATSGRLDPSPLFDVIRSANLGVTAVPVSGADQVRRCIDAVRAAYAITEAVALGVLQPAERWNVSLSAAVDPRSLDATLTALAALDTIWRSGVMPSAISVLGATEMVWANPFSSHRPEFTCDAILNIEWGPVWADIAAERVPDVTIRGVPLPTHAGWDPPLTTERISTPADHANSANVKAALGTLANYLFNIPKFNDGQVEAIQRVLTGHDGVVLLPTGSGKSLIYQVAMLLRPGTTLIVAPIRSLIDDQERRLIEEGIDRVAAIHSGKGLSSRERSALNLAVAAGHAVAALVAPERLQIAGFRESLMEASREGLVNLAVVDEAHCVSEWGHDFRTSYLRLADSLRRYGSDRTRTPPPLLALTGTASTAVLRDLVQELRIDDRVEGAVYRPAAFDRPNLHFEAIVGESNETFDLLRQAVTEVLPDRLGIPLDQLSRSAGSATPCGIIFAPWASEIAEFGVGNVARQVTEFLGPDGLEPGWIGTYSGQMPDSRRIEVAEAFRNNRAGVLVATKAFGMGIDKPNIRWTVHVGIPSSIEAFVQEAGRAGRDREEAHCLIVSGRPSDEVVQRHLDTSVSPSQRRSNGATARTMGDIGRQLFFLYGSFPGAKFNNESDAVARGIQAWKVGEALQAQDAFDHVLAAGGTPGGQVTLPRVPQEVTEFIAAGDLGWKDRQRLSETASQLFDRALQRLAVVGVVEDLTVDYGADSVTLSLAHYTSESVDEATMTFANRIQPGRTADHDAAVAALPDDLHERIRGLLRYVVTLVYTVIEPARLNALREMWRLTTNSPTDESIREFIESYLSAGPMSLTLEELVRAGSIDVPGVLDRIDRVGSGNEFDWAGAAARLLESYPGHPILLFVRAAGEAYRGQGALDAFSGFVDELARSIAPYAIDLQGETALFQRLDDILANAVAGRRDEWRENLWRTWFEVLGPSGSMDAASQQILNAPDHQPPEALNVALDYRLQRISVQPSVNELVSIGES